MAKRSRPGVSGLTNVVGGMLVGFDEQVLRATPRVEILVNRGKAVRGLSSQGGTLLVGLPDDPIALRGREPGDDADDARSRGVVSTSGSGAEPGAAAQRAADAGGRGPVP